MKKRLYCTIKNKINLIMWLPITNSTETNSVLLDMKSFNRLFNYLILFSHTSSIVLKYRMARNNEGPVEEAQPQHMVFRAKTEPLTFF
jgi:hypothetical protein